MSKSNELFMQTWTEYEEEMFNQQAEPEGEPLTKEADMPTVDDIYPSKNGSHLKAADLKGKEIKLGIEGYEVVEFDKDGTKERKLVLSFSGKDKTLVLNKTNSQAIAAGHGDDIDNWKGKNIFIYPTKTDFGGQSVDCIRVRPELEQAEFNDDIPF